MFKFIKRWLDKRNCNFEPCAEPASKLFGFDRGTPIDRVYIEDFLSANKDCIKGSVLEISESLYSKKFGDATNHEILSFSSDNSRATIIGDLTQKITLPENRIDCFICTQTLNFIYDFKAAIEGIRYVLKPGGTALVTVAGLVQISRYDMERWGDYWRFTDLSIKRSFAEVFGENKIKVCSYGNLMTTIAILKGLAAEELSSEQIMKKDQDYQILITVRAEK